MSSSSPIPLHFNFAYPHNTSISIYLIKFTLPLLFCWNTVLYSLISFSIVPRSQFFICDFVSSFHFSHTSAYPHFEDFQIFTTYLPFLLIVINFFLYRYNSNNCFKKWQHKIRNNDCNLFLFFLLAFLLQQVFFASFFCWHSI